VSKREFPCHAAIRLSVLTSLSRSCLRRAAAAPSSTVPRKASPKAAPKSSPKVAPKSSPKTSPKQQPAAPLAANTAGIFSEDALGSLGLCDVLVSHLKEKMNVTKPTVIQKKGIPPMLEVGGCTMPLPCAFPLHFLPFDSRRSRCGFFSLSLPAGS